jgi:leader peptidase (prepilin peptidase) / N-methyltransferase
MSPSLAALALPAALFGACIGSFLNVVAWRLPRQESLVHPGSHCPRCGSPVRWFDNVPVLAWVWLGGRCRDCRTPIASRYPLVELLSAGLWVAMLLAQPAGLGNSPSLWLVIPAGWLLASWLLPLVLIDLDRLWLPEPLCRWGLLLGLLATAAIGFQQGEVTGRSVLLHHLLAAAVGLLGFEATSAIAERLVGKPALGLGDAKLAALLGAWLGLAGLGAMVLLAVFSGAVVGSMGRLSGRLGRHQPFAFGPFLALGGLVVWCTGPSPWLALVLPAAGP